EIRQEGKTAKFPPLDFTSDLPKLLTYHSAKGLTFDSVLLPRLVPGSFGKSTIPERKLLFVGATRATKWVFLSTQRGRELPIIDAWRHCAAAGSLTITPTLDCFLGGRRRTPVERIRPSSLEEEGIGDLF